MHFTCSFNSCHLKLPIMALDSYLTWLWALICQTGPISGLEGRQTESCHFLAPCDYLQRTHAWHAERHEFFMKRRGCFIWFMSHEKTRTIHLSEPYLNCIAFTNRLGFNFKQPLLFSLSKKKKLLDWLYDFYYWAHACGYFSRANYAKHS